MCNMVDPVLITVGAAVVGAGLNTLRGYLHSEFAAIAVAQTIAVESVSIESVSIVGLALIGLTTGFAADFVISKAKKDDE